MGVVRRLARLGVGLAVFLLALTIAAVLYFSDRSLRLHGAGRSLVSPVDAVLVLGGGVDGDGVLSYSSRRRVGMAVLLLKAGRTETLIFSGGPLADPRLPTAAELMRKHAIALGAPPGALLKESRARSTFENIRFGLALAEERGLQSAAILTDAYHLERARHLAAYFGHSDVGLVAVRGLAREPWYERTYHTIREALAWWYNLAKIAAWEALGAAGLDPQDRQVWVQ